MSELLDLAAGPGIEDIEDLVAGPMFLDYVETGRASRGPEDAPIWEEPFNRVCGRFVNNGQWLCGMSEDWHDSSITRIEDEPHPMENADDHHEGHMFISLVKVLENWGVLTDA